MENLIRETSSPKILEVPQQDSVSKEEYLQLLNAQKDLSSKVNDVLSNIRKVENEVTKVHDESKEIKEINEKSMKNLNEVEGKLKKSEELLIKYESGMADLNKRIPELQPVKQEKDWQSEFLNGKNFEPQFFLNKQL